MTPPRHRPTLDRGLSPVVASVLLLAIVLLLAVIFGVVLLEIGETTPERSVRLYVDMDETSAGIAMVPQTVSHPVELYINGVPIMTIEPADTFEELLLPVAPDDVVQFIADIGRQQVVKQEEVDEHEAGDFIAYYTFEAGSGSTVADRSPNDNDLTIVDGSWVSDGNGTAMQFDGVDDHAKVDQLQLTDDATVREFTVAIKYRITGANDAGGIQQLAEHHDAGFEWFVESGSGIGASDTGYRMEYTIYPGEPDTQTSDVGVGGTHVVVATFADDELRLYHNGSLVATRTQAATVEMGELYLGADAPTGGSQYLNGRIYQFRLYYTAFDDEEVDVLTDVMEAEAE